MPSSPVFPVGVAPIDNARGNAKRPYRRGNRAGDLVRG
jgi:hypothetical protein